MRKTLFRIGCVVFLIIVVAQIGAQIVLRTRYADLKPKGIVWYFDGVVINHLQLANGISLKKVFLEGNPIDIVMLKPSYIVITKTEIDASNIDLPQKILFPATPVTVESIELTMPYQNQNYLLTGDFKTFDPQHHRIAFESKTNGVEMSFNIDLGLRKQRLISVDIGAEDFAVDRPEMQVRRGAGWLSFHLQKDQWQSTGELEAGLITYADQVFLDANLTLQDKGMIFNAVEKQSGKKTYIETQSDRLSELQARLLAQPRPVAKAH